MNLTPALKAAYTKDSQSAVEAQKLAHMIAWGPVVFQTARLMIKFGILDMLRDSENGMTEKEIASAANISEYAAKVLLEASLSTGTVIVNPETDRYSITKAGWFLLTDRSVRVNMDFNHDVNYEGWFRLEESLLEGRPAGLEHFGSWPTVYEGLSQLPEQVQKSWFGFDHFYSDNSFDEALRIVFDEHGARTLLDVGGNTGRWAMKCTAHCSDARVTIMDLPQQLDMMRAQTAGKPGADRIDGYGINLLDESQSFPSDRHFDAIWMSQFLDCFSEQEILSILKRSVKAMDGNTRLYIMETFWDRQKYEAAAMCLTMTSLYFTAIANGNSKMYHSQVMQRLVEEAGMQVEEVIDNMGRGGHSIMVCKLK